MNEPEPVFDECNVCRRRFKRRPSGRLDMDDFRAHKATHTLSELLALIEAENKEYGPLTEKQGIFRRYS